MTLPLSYDQIADVIYGSERRELIAATLRSHGGFRFPDKIADDLTKNFDKLQDNRVWAVALAELNNLVAPMNAGQEQERQAARYFQQLLHDFGPKQSRNLLQSLDLTRYEIPINSRITKWLNKFGFPAKLNATALADAGYYEFVLDGFKALCDASEIFPCVLDAAVFASFDGDGWTKENTIY